MRTAWVAYAAVVFVIALVPRLVRIDAHLTPDELRWVCRSANFHAGLRAGEPAATAQTGHPGVITMWLGGLGLPVEPNAEWASACSLSRSSELIYELPRDQQDVILSRLYDGRRRVAIATSVGAAAIGLAAGAAFGPLAALLSAPLVALDPFLLAHSRFLHLDALLAELMALSALLLLGHLRAPNRRGLLLASGAMAGLAALNKSPAIVLAPFAVALVVLGGYLRCAGRREIVRGAATWSTAAFAAFVLLWPALWTSPRTAMGLYVGDILRHGTTTLEDSSFFAGEVVDAPGAAFYPTVWHLRSSPLAEAGVVLALAILAMGALRAWRSRRAEARGGQLPSPTWSAESAVAALLALAVAFAVPLALAPKQYDRYLLPVVVVTDLAGAAGLALVLARVGAPRPRARDAIVTLTAGGALVLQAAMVLPVAPYYVAWFNPLAGGAAAATRLVVVGWGEGLDQAAAWLNAMPDADRMVVATRYRAAFAPLFVGRTIQTESFDPETTDYVIFMRNQVQRGQDPEVSARFVGSAPRRRAAFTAWAAGTDVAWVYSNTESDGPLAYLAASTEPDDVVVARDDSVFARRYDSAPPLVPVPDGAPQEQVYDILARAMSGRRRAWHVRPTSEDPTASSSRVTHGLATATRRVDSRTFGDLTVDLFEVDGEPSFRDVPVAAVDVAVGRYLSLVGIGAPQEAMTHGRDMPVVLDWRASGPTVRDAVLTLQILDADGRMWSQLDVPIADDRGLRTTAWSGGRQVRTRHHLTLPPDLPPGRHELRIGAYTVTGDAWQRFPVAVRDLGGLVDTHATEDAVVVAVRERGR